MEIQAVKNIARFKDILKILLKYGFEDIVEKIKYPGFAIFGHKSEQVDAKNPYERIRLGLEELGPTYVKIGQVLSMRPDLISPQLIEELQKLQDNVPAEEFAVIEKQVESGLGKTMDEIFERFDEIPVSAASIAQVHYAMLREGGREVAVKVQRSGIREIMREDFDILRFAAAQIHKHLEDYKKYDFPSLVEEIWSAMRYELDFTIEARNLEIFELNFNASDTVIIPKVYRKWSSESVLTMDFIKGIKIRNVPPDYPYKRDVAVNGIKAILQQILKDGFFHGDPHGGNILVTEDGRLCFIDFGLVGVLTHDMRRALIELFEAVMDKDSREVVRIGVQISRYEIGIDKVSLERDVLRQLLQFDPTGGHGTIGRSLLELAQIFKRHDVNLHPVYFMIFKTILTAENLVHALCPDCKIWDEIMPFVTKMSSFRESAYGLLKESMRDLISVSRAVREFPDRVDSLLRRIEEQKISFTFRHDGLERFTQSVEDVSNRISFGIIIGSLIIGSSLIVTTGMGPQVFGFPMLGVGGFVISGLMGIWLAIGMIRKRKL